MPVRRAPSSPARTCAGWSRRGAVDRAPTCRSCSRPGGLGRRRRRSAPGSCGPSASCRPPTATPSTPARPCSAYPSLREGFGLPVLEAMAQGAPVVTSAGTATAEVAGDAAVLVDPARRRRRSPTALASVLDDPAGARRAGRAGRARAATFTWSPLRRRATSAAYREAVGGVRVGVNLLWLVPGEVGGSETWMTGLLGHLARPPARRTRSSLFAPAAVAGRPIPSSAPFEVVAAPDRVGPSRPSGCWPSRTWLPLGGPARPRRPAPPPRRHHAVGPGPPGGR